MIETTTKTGWILLEEIKMLYDLELVWFIPLISSCCPHTLCFGVMSLLPTSFPPCCAHHSLPLTPCYFNTVSMRQGIYTTWSLLTIERLSPSGSNCTKIYS